RRSDETLKGTAIGTRGVHRMKPTVRPDRLACKQERIRRLCAEQRLQRTLVGDRVVVHQPQPAHLRGRGGTAHPLVKAPRPAHVPVEPHELGVRELVTDHLAGAVARRVVDHQHVRDRSRLAAQRAEALPQHLATVVGHHDSAHAIVCRHPQDSMLARRMRLLGLSNAYPPGSPGGYAEITADVMEGLAARGHEATMLVARMPAYA